MKRKQRKQTQTSSEAPGREIPERRSREDQDEDESPIGLEPELPQAPARDTIPDEPEPIGARRGPRPRVEKRDD